MIAVVLCRRPPEGASRIHRSVPLGDCMSDTAMLEREVQSLRDRLFRLAAPDPAHQRGSGLRDCSAGGPGQRPAADQCPLRRDIAGGRRRADAGGGALAELHRPLPERLSGADGAGRGAYSDGVAVTVAGALSPERLDARIASWYSVPLVRFLKVNDVVFRPLRFMWLKLVPPSVLYWYLRMEMLPG